MNINFTCTPLFCIHTAYLAASNISIYYGLYNILVKYSDKETSYTWAYT